MLYFLENVLLHRCDYDSILTSKSSYMTNVALHMQFLIEKSGALLTPNLLLPYFVEKYNEDFDFLIVGTDYIDVCS